MAIHGGATKSFANGEGRSADETRDWLLNSAVAGLRLLASLAEGDDLADVRASFLSAASVWSEESPEAPDVQPSPLHPFPD